MKGCSDICAGNLLGDKREVAGNFPFIHGFFLENLDAKLHAGKRLAESEVWEVEIKNVGDLKLNQQFHVRKAVKRDVRCIHASKRGANLGGASLLVPYQPWTNDIM